MSSVRHLRPVLALFWEGDKRILASGFALALTTALAGIALLGLSGWFITATAIAGVSVATALAFDVFMPSAGIRLLALGRTAARYGERLTTHDATLGVLARMRERLFRSWTLPKAAHRLGGQPSRLLFRLTLDIDALDSLYLRVLVPLVAAAGSAFAVTAAIAFIDPWLAAAVGAVLLGGGLGIPLVASRHAAVAARRRAHALEVLRARSIDLVRGQADLAMTNRLGAQMRALGAADARIAAADIDLNRAESNVSFGLGIVSAVLLAGTVVAVAFLAENGTVGAPAATFVVLLTLGALEPFGLLRRGAVEFGRTILAARRLGPALTSPSLRQRMRRPRDNHAAVDLAGVELRFPGMALPVWSDLTLRIGHGERVALVGSSGAGKSTLLALIADELASTAGQVRAAPGTLFTQRTELFRDTLEGNLALARPQASAQDMLTALEDAGLGGFVSRLPNGLKSQIGEGGAGLSAGQARRLALARLFLRDADIWLLDEPSEGLDGETARDVLQRTIQCAGTRTLLIATHCRREASLADRVMVMRNGHIVKDARRGSSEFDHILLGLRPD